MYKNIKHSNRLPVSVPVINLKYSWAEEITDPGWSEQKMPLEWILKSYKSKTPLLFYIYVNSLPTKGGGGRGEVNLY